MGKGSESKERVKGHFHVLSLEFWENDVNVNRSSEIRSEEEFGFICIYTLSLG